MRNASRQSNTFVAPAKVLYDVQVRLITVNKIKIRESNQLNVDKVQIVNK